MNEIKTFDFEIMKGLISEMTGVPTELLTGNSVDEIKEQAYTLKKWQNEGNGVMTPRDQFVRWMDGEYHASNRLTQPVTGKYLVIKDGGSPAYTSSTATTAGAFADWFNRSRF